MHAIQQNYITVICWGQETIFPATASHGKIIFNHPLKLATSPFHQYSLFVKMASNNPNGDGNGMENWDTESQTKAKLIEEIKNPCIYNKADPNHYHLDKKLEIFNNIGRMLGMDGK